MYCVLLTRNDLNIEVCGNGKVMSKEEAIKACEVMRGHFPDKDYRVAELVSK